MAQSQSDASILCGLALVSLVHDIVIKSPTGRGVSVLEVGVSDGTQSTLQPWAGGAVVSAPILVSGGQRFESSPVHFFSLLSVRRYATKKKELTQQVVVWLVKL